MFCQVCGKSLEDGALFCSGCGTSQSARQSAVPAATAAPAMAATPSSAAGRVDLGRVLSDSFSDYKGNFLTHLVATLVISVIGGVAFGLLSGPLQTGYMKLEDRAARGESPEIGDVFKGFDDFLPAFVAFLICAIAIGIGFLLCFIPGLIAMPLMPVSLYLVAKGEKDGVQAVKRAWGYLSGNLPMAVITMVVLGALGSLGAVFCFVGIIFTLPLIYIGSYHLARQVVGDAPAAAQMA